MAQHQAAITAAVAKGMPEKAAQSAQELVDLLSSSAQAGAVGAAASLAAAKVTLAAEVTASHVMVVAGHDGQGENYRA